MSDVDVSEVVALAADLAAAPAAAVKVQSETLTKLGRQVAAEANRDAPVGETGDLAGSYKVRGGTDWRRIYSDVRYAGYVELGTSVMAPQPHLWPAGRRAESELFAELRSKIDPLP